MIATTDDEYISPREAAPLLGLKSERAVLAMIERGELASSPRSAGQKVRHRLKRADVQELARKRQSAGT